jgi:hypothetical protein
VCAALTTASVTLGSMNAWAVEAPVVPRMDAPSSNPRTREQAKLGSSARKGEDARLAASMSCERAAEPGRVKCFVEARATGGRSIAWADVAILELPEVASALKGRIGPVDATSRDASSQKWAFGLVARKNGEGEARARVRAVVCEQVTADASAPKCAPVAVEVRATIHVG